MKEFTLVYGIACFAGLATAVAVAGGRGPNDTQEIAAGFAVFASLVALTTPLLWLARNEKSLRGNDRGR